MEGFFGSTEAFFSIGLSGLLAIELRLVTFKLGVVCVGVFRPFIIVISVKIEVGGLLIVHGFGIEIICRLILISAK
jgi:hypothetical protein